MDDGLNKAIDKAKGDARKMRILAIIIICGIGILYLIFAKLGFLAPDGGGGL